MENANKAFGLWWQDYQAHYRARPVKDVFEYPKALMKEAYQAGYEDAIQNIAQTEEHRENALYQTITHLHTT